MCLLLGAYLQKTTTCSLDFPDRYLFNQIEHSG
jgi:hypothetical protein